MDASFLDLIMAQQDEVLEEAEGGGGVWVVADVLDGSIAPVTLEAIGAARSLADALGAYVYAVVVDHDGVALAEPLYQAGADGVRVALVDSNSVSSLAVEPCLEILSNLFEAEQPEIVLFGATEAGQALAPRLAQRMGGHPRRDHPRRGGDLPHLRWGVFRDQDLPRGSTSVPHAGAWCFPGALPRRVPAR